MHRVVAATVAVIALRGVPPQAAAQRLSPGYLGGSRSAPSNVARSTPDRESPRFNDGAMVVGGLAAGVVGFYVGGYTGAALGGGNRVCGDDPCGLVGAVWGAAAGVSTFIPLGVHLANHRRGSYGAELAASLLVGAVGVGLAFQANDAVPLLFVPVGQLVTSILIEHAIGGR